jgi:hypothetical protein
MAALMLPATRLDANPYPETWARVFLSAHAACGFACGLWTRRQCGGSR